MQLIEPKDILIDGINYVISKFPAIHGREIVAKYPLSGLPKLGDYKVNEETMLKLMAFVGVRNEAGLTLLNSPGLVNNHVKSWETLGRIEWAMLEYNCSFFQKGRLSTFLEDIAQKLPQWISKILTDSLERLSQKEKQP